MSGIVIVGGGLAAARAAHYLKEEGYPGDLTIIAGENHYPYQRPPLSKRYLRGGEGLEEVFANPEEWYAKNNVTVITGVEATNLDTAGHELTLADGRTLQYDKLLIATGSAARKLPIQGADLDGVMSLRTLDDSNALKEQLQDGGKQVVLIGSGWIGTEIAASATRMGNQVTVLEAGAVPLANVLGDTIGADIQKMHEEHGVKFKMNAKVESIVGDKHVTGVVVDGETVPADLVLIGVGAVPNTQLAESAGLEVDNGILVDSALQTSAADVFAAGDVANIDHAGAHHRVRAEHWAVARATGKAAARSMLGKPINYDEIPYFYTDQFEFSMELSGYPHLMRDAEIVIRGSLADRKYIAFWINDGKVVAGMNVNVWDVNDKVQALIKSEQKVSVEKLTDEGVSLDELIG